MIHVRPTGSLDKLARNTASIYFLLLSMVTNRSQQTQHRRLAIFDATNSHNCRSRLFAQARDGSRPADPMADHLLHTRGGQCGVQI